LAEMVETHVDAHGAGDEGCLDQIRGMVLSGKLLPGQKVHQGELANQLKISRIPVREALATLQAEGVLVHKPNTGFTVARFNSEDLAEIYLMRRLLETELLQSIDLSTVDVDRMAKLHEQMKGLRPASSPETYQRLNREFHFTLFDSSSLKIVRQEVSRLWYMSGFYRSLYLYEPATAIHLADEHAHIIEAVRDGNVKRLVEVANQHRSGTERMVIQRLGRSRDT
jgi:DNA-binding GntR family transcriptional regulator